MGRRDRKVTPEGTKIGKHALGHLIITCDPSNTASYKTCEYAGGRYIETADIPEDNDMYAEGKRKVRIYRFEL